MSGNSAADLPARLYKYVTTDRIDVLEGGLIAFTQPSRLNDPFEHAAKLSGFFPTRNDEEQAVAGASSRSPGQVISRLFAYALKTLPGVSEPYLRPNYADTHGSLSLAADPDNLLLWAHYADEHRGFVIELDSTHPFFDARVDDTKGGRLSEVRYVEDRPVLPLAEYYRAALFKSPHWSYEREWRLIRPIDEADRRITVGGQAVHLFALPAECVSAVILGCRVSDALKQRMATLLMEDARYAHVRLLFALEDADRYAVRLAGEGWLHIQRALRAADRQDEAALFEHLDDAIAVEPENAAYLYLRGMTRLAAGESAEARLDLERSVELNPLDSAVWAALHELALSSGDRKRAGEAIDRAIEVDRGNADLYRTRAAMRFAEQAYTGAIEDSSRALQIEPDDIVSAWRRASAFAKMGNFKAALADVDHAISLDPSNTKFQQARAQALRALGDAAVPPGPSSSDSAPRGR